MPAGSTRVVTAGPPPGMAITPPAAEPRWRPVTRRFALLGLAGVPLLVILVLFCYPVATLIGRGLLTGGHLDLSTATSLWERPRFRRILVFTVAQAAGSAGLCLVFGLPGAYLLYRKRFRGRGLIRAVLTVPFVLPTVVVALAVRTVVAPGGPLGSWDLDGSVVAILAAHVCLNYAVVVRTVGVAWSRLDTRPAEAAAGLGAGPVRVFVTVTLPALGPAVAAAVVLVFLFCATSFGIVLLVGGARYNTLETEIYRQTVELLDLPAASVLSIAQLLLVAATLAVAGWLRRRVEISGEPRPPARPLISIRDLPAMAVTGLAALVVLGPLVVLVLRSLRSPAGWSLTNYASLGSVGDSNALTVPVTTALGISLRTAAVATALALALGGALAVVLARRPRSARTRRLLQTLDAVVMLPLGVSAVTVGFGFLIALDKPPLNLRGSVVLLPLAQALVAMPLVVRLVLPALRGVDDRLRQAAAGLGAGPLRVWRDVDLPAAGRALAGAGAFALAVTLGEFGAASFLVIPQRPTLPVLIGLLIARPGAANTGTALAAATVLALLCLLVVAAVDLLSGDRPGAIGGF